MKGVLIITDNNHKNYNFRCEWNVEYTLNRFFEKFGVRKKKKTEAFCLGYYGLIIPKILK